MKTISKFCAIACLAVVAVTFSGCGSSSGQKPQSQSTQTQQTPTTWNKEKKSTKDNNNIPVAVRELKKHATLAEIAEDCDPVTVMKAPWDYYGKVLKVTGKVVIIQSLPPDSGLAKAMGGEVCQIVMYAPDRNNVIEGYFAGKYTEIEKGQVHTVYGYPCGIDNVPTKDGKPSDHLIFVGRLH